VIETAPGELEAQTVFNRIRFGGIVINLKIAAGKRLSGLAPHDFAIAAVARLDWGLINRAGLTTRILTNLTMGSCMFQGPGTGTGFSFAITGTTPIPSALPIFATGLGALGLLAWRTKRKAH